VYQGIQRCNRANWCTGEKGDKGLIPVPLVLYGTDGTTVPQVRITCRRAICCIKGYFLWNVTFPYHGETGDNWSYSYAR